MTEAIDRARVILVEDDDELREATVQALSIAGMEVLSFGDADSALGALPDDFDGVVVTDIRLPRTDGLELFATLSTRDPELPVVLMTGHGDVAMAVDAMKRGAADFLTKPFATSALIETIERAAVRRTLVIENRRLREALRNRTTAGLLGTSEQARRLERLTTEVARTDLDIQISGPPGTGKTHLAHRIHELSPRSNRPFVAIDSGVWSNGDAELLVFGRDPAAGLSRSGLVERARGGTLLLDDAETIPSGLHGRLRSLLEKREIRPLGADRPLKVDVRIIATRGGQTAATIATGEASLLDHLGGVTIAIPPLVDRKDDVPVAFRHFVGEFERQLDTTANPLTSAEWTFLLSHDWPGGLRELRDFARVFVLGLSRLATPAAGAASPGSSLRELVGAFERAVLEDALRKGGGRVDIVQRMLSVKRKTLYDKLARYDLKPQSYR